MTLLQQVAAADAAALDLYRELLARDSNPKSGDAARLKAVMGELGLSPDDVRGDAAALSTARRLEVAVAQIPELDRKRIEASKALADYGEETHRLEYERSVRQGELDLESARIESRLHRLHESQQKLVLHRRQHARLFGGRADTEAPPEPVNMIG